MNMIALDSPVVKFRGSGPHITRVPRILCVDDDPDISTTIDLRLSPYNVKVERAFYGMQGIWEAVQTKPDAIIMDLAMPNGDGQYVLECIKRNADTAGIPVIILTGMRDSGLKHQLISAGADVFMQKPLQADELIHHLSRFIDLRKNENS